ncbi:putative pyrroloquinoline-quinone binding quinoprotein [Saccharothrix carnea]|uniref:Putative pyrroloquinoline-quinone binding quinoprotein n=1 Tax=Saccharothrix carnea TaxID=1280637 RepID=A0A2P8IGA7_SACCR|nr:PQQ-binding-like beta-propeller repeat protein [Saccharothrix carnea]PSL57506.1 putative pyrroloquinoline-quinone binding quinoprotein [Saccharothrix carnea]
MLRYMTVVGALCAGVAPFLSGGVPRPEADPAVIGSAVGVVLAAALAVGGGRARRVFAAVAGTGLAVTVWWLLVSDLLVGLTGHDLPVLAVGSLAVAVGAIESAVRRTSAVPDRAAGTERAGTGEAPGAVPVASGDEVARAGSGDQPGRAVGSGGWRVRPVGVVAVLVVAVAAVFAPVVAEGVIVRSETRDARDFAAEPVVERPGGGQWAWQPAADVVDVVPVLHGVAVATRDGAVVGLNGTDGRVEWRYARPGAPVGEVVASVDRRTVLVSFRSLRDTRKQAVVVLDADTGTPRFEKVVRSVSVETGQLMLGTRMLTIRDHEVITGYDVVDGGSRWQWSPPEGCTTWFGQVVRGRTTVLVPVVCADTLGVTALDEVTGRERWRHELRRGDSGGERPDVQLHGTANSSIALLQIFGAQPTPDAVPNGLLDTETGRVLSRPERPSNVRTDVGVTPLLEEHEGGQVTGSLALDPATGATTRLSIEHCPRRTADVTTSTTYVRACADNGRELTVVTQPLDGSAPTSTPVRLDGSGSRARSDVRLVAAPGAIVLTRTAFGGTAAPVVGLTG